MYRNEATIVAWQVTVNERRDEDAARKGRGEDEDRVIENRNRRPIWPRRLDRGGRTRYAMALEIAKR